MVVTAKITSEYIKLYVMGCIAVETIIVIVSNILYMPRYFTSVYVQYPNKLLENYT